MAVAVDGPECFMRNAPAKVTGGTLLRDRLLADVFGQDGVVAVGRQYDRGADRAAKEAHLAQLLGLAPGPGRGGEASGDAIRP